MAGWFEQNGFTREDRIAARAEGGYENGTMPVGTPVAAAQPGMTREQLERIVSDPSNARISSGGSGGGYQPYSDDTFLQILHKYPPTYEGAQQAQAEIERTFGPGVVSLMDHPTKLDKFVLPGGRTADMMYASGSPQARWNDSITLERGSGGGGSVGALGGMTGGNWQAGIDPSYEWRFKEGQKALERSAASKGTLLTGGTLKALAGYGQGLASTEFGNIFNRNYQLAGLGLNAAQSGAQTGTSYGNQVGNTAANQAQTGVDLTTGAGNAQAAGSVASGNAWGNTLGTLANIAGQYYMGKRAGRTDGTV